MRKALLIKKRGVHIILQRMLTFDVLLHDFNTSVPFDNTAYVVIL